MTQNSYKKQRLKKETLKHQKAFDLYYSLGESRSLPQVAKETGISVTSIKRWAVSFNWQNRVIERDRKNALRIQKRTDTQIVNEKAEYRRQIKSAIGIVLAGFQKVFKRDPKTEELIRDSRGNPILNIEVNNVKDLQALVYGLERLIRLDMVLLGDLSPGADNYIAYIQSLEVYVQRYIKADERVAMMEADLRKSTRHNLIGMI